MHKAGSVDPQPLSQWLAQRRQRLDERLASLRQRSQLVGQRLHLEGITEQEAEGVGVPELLKRLLAAEQHMRRMLVDTPVPVLVLDSQHRVRLSNKALIRLLEASGQNLAQLYSEPVDSLFPGVFDQHEIELAVTGPDASQVLAVKRQTVLWGQAEAQLILLYDVTPEVRARQELQRAVAQLEEVNQLKSDFVATASHEFRTPLAGVLSSLELIDTYLERSEGLDDWSRARVTMHLDRSRAVIDQLNTLVGDMLVLEKASGGYFVCEPEAVHLDAWLQQLLDGFQSLSERQQIALQLHLTTTRAVRLDQRLLRHCLNNLIGNALRFSPAGATVTVSAEERGNELRLSVTDTGPGIPEHDQTRIFEPFFRGHNAGLSTGTGLGLSIVHRFIDLLGGQIELSSEVGRGSCFTLRLPLVH